MNVWHPMILGLGLLKKYVLNKIKYLSDRLS